MNSPLGRHETCRRRNLLVIHNPTAGHRRRRFLAAVLAELARLGCVTTLRATRDRGDAAAFARDAAPDAWDAIVVAGGDGTVNEVANGLCGRPTPLAVIPFGTANVLACEVGMPRSARAVAAMIADGPARTVHVGVANRRVFLLMAGVGFDAHVVKAMNPALKRRLGGLAYVWAAMRQMGRFGFGPYVVTVDDQPFTAASVIVANAHYYGGRFSFAPQARLSDPRLHAVLFLKPGVLRLLRTAFWLLLGRIDRLPDVRVVPGFRITVEGRTGEPVQADGDLVTELPLTVFAAGSPVVLVVPTDAGADQVLGSPAGSPTTTNTSAPGASSRFATRRTSSRLTASIRALRRSR